MDTEEIKHALRNWLIAVLVGALILAVLIGIWIALGSPSSWTEIAR